MRLDYPQINIGIDEEGVSRTELNNEAYNWLLKYKNVWYDIKSKLEINSTWQSDYLYFGNAGSWSRAKHNDRSV